MKRICSLGLCLSIAFSVVGWLGTNEARAIKEFKDEFDKKYKKDPPVTPEEKELDKAIEDVKCGICHEGEKGKDKKKRNPYGQELNKLIKKADKKDQPKIQDALDKVAKEHTDPNDPKSPTFGDRLKEGKLPVEPKP